MASLRSWPIYSLALVLSIAAYFHGLDSYPREQWPMTPVRSLLGVPMAERPASLGTHDKFGHLVAFPGKVEVACPAQSPETALLLVIGQSNAGNHGDTPVKTRHPDRVLNFFAGKCYVAGSPLLGASGEGGEFITLLADKLVDDGAYKAVIVMDTAVTDTPIARWKRDGDLNVETLAALHGLPDGYHVTQIVWHQGENDLLFKTSAQLYQTSFRSMLSALRDAGVDAPAFLAVATTCGTSRREHNEVAGAQLALVDDRSIFLGADTDTMLTDLDRKRDGCHLSESGERKTALAYAAAIEKSLARH